MSDRLSRGRRFGSPRARCDRGNAMVVVSGALDVYVAPWCHAHGLELMCSALEQRSGILTGRYRGEQCVLEEKSRCVRQAHDLTRYGRIHACGNASEDRELLAMPDEAWYRWQPFDAAR